MGSHIKKRIARTAVNEIIKAVQKNFLRSSKKLRQKCWT